MSDDTDIAAVIDLPEMDRSLYEKVRLFFGEILRELESFRRNPRKTFMDLCRRFWRALKGFCRKLWQLLIVTGPLVLILLAFKVPDAVGLAAALRHFFWFGIPVPSFTPEVRLILSPRVEVLSSVVKSLSWQQFIIIGVMRRMVADPLYYYIGKRGIRVIANDASTKSGRLAIRLEHARHWKILAVVGVLTFVESVVPAAVSPFLIALNPYIFAGSAEVKLKWVLAVDAVSSIAFMLLFFLYGSDLVNALWAML